MSESPEQLFDPSDVTRVEIIDHRTGSRDVRAYQAHNCSVRLAVQDDGRTLKVFVGDNGRKSVLFSTSKS